MKKIKGDKEGLSRLRYIVHVYTKIIHRGRRELLRDLIA